MDDNIPWGLVVIGGPLLLGLVLMWAVFRNRTTRAQRDRTETGTRELREQIERDDARAKHP